MPGTIEDVNVSVKCQCGSQGSMIPCKRTDWRDTTEPPKSKSVTGGLEKLKQVIRSVRFLIDGFVRGVVGDFPHAVTIYIF